ncbi:hypothetical protein RchiOBHm_Chr4g0420931 [Rosa chinensis]|uniref:SAGA-associated factor 11 n=2 Tax=Rosa chinensis TaxID=74649 RepID=A0A2P6QXZ1_ROSCH|nr:uncharacterized protein LOC112201017 isoform X1 [Rosa chinensis]XP_040375200.1 uncharacterized protein LOC112201017 isoform X1 [Rosa chinensis]PRQ39063.1 hypothetical protein RchiOBHm_Chr4g0420931 [Rosa chinensis]
MVCSVGSGRMAVMARVLAGGSVSHSLAEEAPHQKFAAHLICRQLIEANDANLLDEEDMHVFDLEPMADTLLLVCCNACKKPVKASQYAAHSVLCRSLNSTQETNLELDGSIGQRKPPRKEKKKLLTAYAHQATSVRELQRSESADDIAVSQPQLDGKIGMNSSCGMGAKGNSASVETTYMMDGSGVTPENTSYSTSLLHPPTKRFKMIASEQPPLSDDLGTTSIVSELKSTQEACPYCPVPLATKVYYSQRSNRLRTALCHLYSEAVASNKELCTVMRDEQSLPSIRTPDQILAQNSEDCLEKSIGSLPAGDLSNQFPIDNVPRPQAAGVGLTRTKLLSKPYSFAGSSGQSLGTMQQRNGRVPVV